MLACPLPLAHPEGRVHRLGETCPLLSRVMLVSEDTRSPSSRHGERRTCHLPLDQVPCKPLPAWGSCVPAGQLALCSRGHSAQFGAGLSWSPSWSPWTSPLWEPSRCSTTLFPRSGGWRPDSWTLLRKLPWADLNPVTSESCELGSKGCLAQGGHGRCVQEGGLPCRAHPLPCQQQGWVPRACSCPGISTMSFPIGGVAEVGKPSHRACSQGASKAGS